MGKILVFNGSPHKKGTTTLLLDEVVNGAKSKGAEVIEYDLNDKELRCCQGCNACRKEDAVACAQNDYLKPMYAELKDADGIVLGAPIYMSTVSAQAWILINRLFPAMGTDFKPRFPGKNFVTVITQGNADAEAYKSVTESIQGFFKGLGWVAAGDVTWAGANKDALPEELKNAAFAAGERLVK